MGTERELGSWAGTWRRFPIMACLAKVNGVFKVFMAQIVWSFPHQCCQDVGRKDVESRGGVKVVRQVR